MTDKTPLSQKVRDVCARHFDDGRGCHACPVRKECHSSPTMNVTYQGLEDWRLRLNAAAASHITDNLA